MKIILPFATKSIEVIRSQPLLLCQNRLSLKLCVLTRNSYSITCNIPVGSLQNVSFVFTFLAITNLIIDKILKIEQISGDILKLRRIIGL